MVWWEQKPRKLDNPAKYNFGPLALTAQPLNQEVDSKLVEAELHLHQSQEQLKSVQHICKLIENDIAKYDQASKEHQQKKSRIEAQLEQL